MTDPVRSNQAIASRQVREAFAKLPSQSVPVHQGLGNVQLQCLNPRLIPQRCPKSPHPLVHPLCSLVSTEQIEHIAALGSRDRRGRVSSSGAGGGCGCVRGGTCGCSIRLGGAAMAPRTATATPPLLPSPAALLRPVQHKGHAISTGHTSRHHSIVSGTEMIHLTLLFWQQRQCTAGRASPSAH